MKIKKQITVRELQLLLLIAKGKTSKEIAREFEISEKTVEQHRKNLLSKFDAINAAHLIFITAKSNII